MVYNCPIHTSVVLLWICQIIQKKDNTKRRAGGPGGLEGHVAKWKTWNFRGLASCQRWPELYIQTPTLLLFQNFWIRFRVRKFFIFENPTPVQTPATIINPTLIDPCFYLRNDHTDSCYCRNWKATPVQVRFFLNFRLRIRVRKENSESCRSRLRYSESGPTCASCTEGLAGMLHYRTDQWAAHYAGLRKRAGQRVALFCRPPFCAVRGPALLFSVQPAENSRFSFGNTAL